MNIYPFVFWVARLWLGSFTTTMPLDFWKATSSKLHSREQCPKLSQACHRRAAPRQWHKAMNIKRREYFFVSHEMEAAAHRDGI